MIKIEYVDHMGDSLTAVNAARISFKTKKTVLDDKDKKLLEYLAKHSHFSPFEHMILTVKIECPIYIRSQIMRHRTAAFNEQSRRYTSKDIKFYLPEKLRLQSKDNRQASYGALDPSDQESVLIEIDEFHQKAMNLYNDLLAIGVCREQARGVLPQNMMTEFIMTCNLRNWVNFIKLRDHVGAQYEVQIIAKEIKKILIDKFGYSAEVLFKELKNEN